LAYLITPIANLNGFRNDISQVLPNNAPATVLYSGVDKLELNSSLNLVNHSSAKSVLNQKILAFHSLVRYLIPSSSNDLSQ